MPIDNMLRPWSMEQRMWYVAIIRPMSEDRCADALERLGHECYVPRQTVEKVTPQGRRRRVERVVLRARIFVHCTERERMEIVRLPFISRFMTNICGTKVNGHNPLATVPDEEMAAFRRMLESDCGEVEVFEGNLSVGDEVEIQTPSMKGLRGVIDTAPGGESYFYVRLGTFACARMKVKRSDVRKVEE